MAGSVQGPHAPGLFAEQPHDALVHAHIIDVFEVDRVPRERVRCAGLKQPRPASAIRRALLKPSGPGDDRFGIAHE